MVGNQVLSSFYVVFSLSMLMIRKSFMKCFIFRERALTFNPYPEYVTKEPKNQREA